MLNPNAGKDIKVGDTIHWRGDMSNAPCTYEVVAADARNLWLRSKTQAGTEHVIPRALMSSPRWSKVAP